MPRPVVGRGVAAAVAGDDRVGDDHRLALGEHARLRRADAGDVADRVHVGERRLERVRVDRDPAVDAEPGRRRRPSGARAWGRRGTGRRAARCRRRAWRPCARGRARARHVRGPTSMPRSANAASSASDAAGDGGIGTGNGITSDTSDCSRTPVLTRCSCSEQRGLARRRRALERRRRDPDDHPSAGEVGEHVAQRERAGVGVELVAALDQAGRRRRVEVGAERDHQDVGLERAGVGLDPLGRAGRSTAPRPARTARPASRRRRTGGTPRRRSCGRTSRRASRSRTRSRRTGRSARRRRRHRARPTTASSAPDPRTPRPAPRPA